MTNIIVATESSETRAPSGLDETAMPTAFFTLPIELRFLIYNYALLGRLNGDKKEIHVDIRMDKERSENDDLSISPAILQTCKMVYLEASPILYAKNEFAVYNPQSMIAFMQKVGLTNTKHLKSLVLRVEWHPIPYWVELLHNLSENATGLRKITICFDLRLASIRKETWPIELSRGHGDNLPFVRALATIQGLTTMKVEGFYAQQWPAYLEEKMGVSVHATRGFTGNKAEVLFMYYQQQAKNLIP